MVYTFVCEECGWKVDTKENSAPTCPQCGKSMQKVFYPPQLILHSDAKAQDEIDKALADFYKGQEELDKGELTQMEIEDSYALLEKRAEKLGKDKGYYFQNPPKLTKEEMAKKAQEQIDQVKKLIK